jgi:hypothetical protein
MPASLQHDRGNVYRIDLRGRLRASDFRDLEYEAVREIRRAGALRLLIVLADFEGWDDGSDWHNLGFYVKHGADIERIAIVGDPRWRGEALMFAGAGLRTAPVEFFEPQDLPRAEGWLAG